MLHCIVCNETGRYYLEENTERGRLQLREKKQKAEKQLKNRSQMQRDREHQREMSWLHSEGKSMVVMMKCVQFLCEGEG